MERLTDGEQDDSYEGRLGGWGMEQKGKKDSLMWTTVGWGKGDGSVRVINGHGKNSIKKRKENDN